MIPKKDIEKYWQWLREGKSPEEVKRDMLIRGISEEESSQFLKDLDTMNFINRIEEEKSYHSKSYRIVGLILIFVSIGFIIYTLLYSTFSIATILYFSSGAALGFAAINYANRINGKGIFKNSRIQNRYSRRH